MDFTTMLEMAGVSTTGVAIVLIVYRLMKSLRGKKLVSSCCGAKMEAGFDVQEMTNAAEKAAETPSAPEVKVV